MPDTTFWLQLGLLVVALLTLFVIVIRALRGQQTDSEQNVQKAEDIDADAFQQIQGRGHTIIGTQASSEISEDEKEVSSDVSLVDRVRENLHNEGKLADAVGWARRMAKERGLEEEVDWLRWEEFGMRPGEEDEVGDEWRDRAPYRIVDVELLFPKKRFISEPEPLYRFQGFWGRPIAEVEEALRKYDQRGRGMITSEMPLAEIVPEGSEAYETYPGEAALVRVPESELQSIVTGLRVEIGRFLDSVA